MCIGSVLAPTLLCRDTRRQIVWGDRTEGELIVDVLYERLVRFFGSVDGRGHPIKCVCVAVVVVVP